MTRVLVVAAHPDDELLGPGATLAKHAARGDEVHALILSEGASSRYADDMQETLAVSAERAGKVLGLCTVTVRPLPDQRLDALALLDLTREVETACDLVDPHIVYTHFPGDVNADHAAVARATWNASRPYVAPRLHRFAVFETPSSTEWGWPVGGEVFRPNCFVDVTRTLDTKLQAMSCYESELRPEPHPRSLSALRSRAATWGSVVGRRAAEPFQVLREVL
jgi:LmbE family N-acetylglucosaminyl deacetylase